MNNVSTIIHSYNNETLIDCVQSALLLTKNVFVIGEEKRQQVHNDLKKLGVIFIPFSNREIVEPAREFGINQVKTDWVFLLDADERMTKELVAEITDAVFPSDVTSDSSTASVITHYKVPRKEIVFGTRWLKHGGWWPNYQIRLIRKSAFISWPKKIHSTPVINGECGYLDNGLLHYSQNNIEEIVVRTIVFEDKESDLLFQAGRQTNTLTFFRKFLGELWRRLILRLGFLDGNIGIIESIYQAFSKTITYIYLYEKNRRPIRPIS